MGNGNLGERLLQTTADGSHTLYLPAMDEHYHSVNGAIGESEHIFVNAGLRSLAQREIRVLEIGFGTGLNAFLTLREVMADSTWRIVYYAVELYPLPFELATRLNYAVNHCFWTCIGLNGKSRLKLPIVLSFIR